MLAELKKFVIRGNVLDLAIGVVIGAAFGKIVTSLVNDVLMPPIGLVLGKVDFTNLFVNLGHQRSRRSRTRRRPAPPSSPTASSSTASSTS